MFGVEGDVSSVLRGHVILNGEMHRSKIWMMLQSFLVKRSSAHS